MKSFLTTPQRFLDKETIQKVQEFGNWSSINEGNSLTTYAIGDIHGMREMLVKLLVYLTSLGKHPVRVVFTGDYVDRGPDSLGVIAIVRLLQEIMGSDRCIALRGNHEDMLIHELKKYGAIYQDPKSYGYTRTPGVHNKPDDDVVRWLKSLPYMYEDDLHYYVHAGFEPFKSIHKQNNETMIWIRDEFLQGSHDFGKHVFHGHTPRMGFETTQFRTNLDTGAVFGGVLCAAEIDADKRLPVAIHYVYKDFEGRSFNPYKIEEVPLSKEDYERNIKEKSNIIGEI